MLHANVSVHANYDVIVHVIQFAMGNRIARRRLYAPRGCDVIALLTRALCLFLASFQL